MFNSDKKIITPKDVPQSTVDQEKLIEIIAKILSDVRSTGKRSFTSEELHIAYQWQGLNYETEDEENALKFLSTTPFSIITKEGNKYLVSDDINTLLKKTGLLLQAFNRIKGAI